MAVTSWLIILVLLLVLIVLGTMLLLMQRDMGGFFGDFLRYVDVLDDTVKFYEFDRPGSGETDWAIMKACLVNAGDLILYTLKDRITLHQQR
jgi:hypothetical protein